MKFLKCVMAVSIFSGIQAAQHPAEKLAQAFIALVGERYGKASSMSVEFEVALDALYSEAYTSTSNNKILVSSRVDFKKGLRKAKRTGGLWRVTDVVYVPDDSNNKCCKITFRWWTEKNGVFDIDVTMRSSVDGKRIESVNEMSVQVYTASEVS